MIGALAFILFATLVGVPFVHWLDHSCRGYDLAARSYLTGLGIVAVDLFFLSVLGAPWNRMAVAGSCALLAGLAVVASRKTKRREEPVAFDVPSEEKSDWILAGVLDALSALLIAGYAIFATAAVPEFDFLSDWGLKGRVFWERGAIDWNFLEHATYRATHADYPLLLPLSFDGVAIFAGQWRDSLFGVLYVAFALATLIVLRKLLEREDVPRTGRALATLIFAPFALSPWIGLGEGAFVAYGSCGLLLLVAALRGEGTAIGSAGLLLGIGALAKNEGLAFFLVVIVAALMVYPRSWKKLIALWPGVLLASSWQLVRALHRLPTDLASGSVGERLQQHLLHPGPLVHALARYAVGKELFWCSVIVALLLTLRATVVRYGVALLAITLQFLSYLLAYAATPHDIDWHVRWSWERLVSHLALSLAFLAFGSLAPLVWERNRSKATGL